MRLFFKSAGKLIYITNRADEHTHITPYIFNKVKQLAKCTHTHTHTAKQVKQVSLTELVRCAAFQAFVPSPFKGKGTKAGTITDTAKYRPSF